MNKDIGVKNGPLFERQLKELKLSVKEKGLKFNKQFASQSAQRHSNPEE